MDVNGKREVSWLPVLGGLLAAWFAGIFVNILAIAGGAAMFEEPTLGISVAVAAVALFYAAIFWLTRRRWRDFAIGFLVGGCMMAILAGTCGALLSGVV